ncbi:MAG: enoyl-CoA hydratase/isomerase family protein [Saprospiraceae bacterium]|nr:enoyl-CoA hydratase/isomerase family protein [Saprospiraceae bacterium]
MVYENLQITHDNGIALVTISREKALNALNTQTMLELRHFFGEAAFELEDLKGIVLTGAGEKAFVAGADITEFSSLSAPEGMQMAKRGQDIFFLVERFPKPVVAAVNGFALGGGCELAMACHLRVAGEKAKFGQPEVNLGLIPGYGGTQRLIQYIGKTKAIELLMTADMLGAAEALQLGLVNYVVPAGEEVSKATELIEKIAAKAPFAISKIIETVNAYYEEGVDGFWKEVDAFGECCGTDDFREGATAFVEKRKANFQGK